MSKKFAEIYTKGIELNNSTSTLIELPFIADYLRLAISYEEEDCYISFGKTPSSTEGTILTKYAPIELNIPVSSFQGITKSGEVFVYILAYSYKRDIRRDVD